MIDKLTFRGFRAINEIETCIRYKEGHGSVLKDYGITNITSNNDSWMKDPNMYCVIAETQDQEIVGGIRVQVSDGIYQLPVESAVGKMDRRIHTLVNFYRLNGGVGELCALWNAKKISGIGVSVLLTRAGISITNQLNFRTLIGICAEYTLKMFQNVGFVVDTSLGFNGSFPYPREEYNAQVLGIMNSETLETANEYDKLRMKSIRENPNQLHLENGSKPNIQLEVKYNLIIKL